MSEENIYINEYTLLNKYAEDKNSLTDEEYTTILSLFENAKRSVILNEERTVTIWEYATGKSAFAVYDLSSGTKQLKEIFVFTANTKNKVKRTFPKCTKIVLYNCDCKKSFKQITFIILAILVTAFLYGLTNAALGGKGGLLLAVPFVFLLIFVITWLKEKY